MIKKLILLLLVVCGGVVTTNADNPYKIVGGFSSWTYGDVSSQWTMTQSGTSNIWYCIVKNWEATSSSIEWKVNNNDSWIPESNNKTSTFTEGDKYNLLFVLNTDDKTVKLVSSVSIHGSFDSWGSGSELSMGESGLDFNGTVNIANAGEEFKFLISYNGDSSNDDVWIGYNSGAALDALSGAIYDSEGDNHNYAFSNIANGFNTFNIKASWDPSKGHTSTYSAWTISITPGEENSTAKKLFFTNPDNWANVYAYNYNNKDDKEKAWPGYSISKVNGFYTYFYTNAKNLIIFTNNSGAQYPTTSGFHVVENAYYGANGQIQNETLTLGAHGYTTFASSCPLNLDGINEGITAYYVANSPTTTVKLTKATGNIAAGEGIILYGENPNAEVTIPVTASGSAISGNMLVGCPTGTTLDSQTANYSTIYVLVNTNERPEFQNVNTWIAGGKTVTIPAGKAYLQASAVSAPSFSLEFDGETTGIANIESTISDNQYYTLDGRRVAQPTKGLYIVNGKKVIIK